MQIMNKDIAKKILEINNNEELTCFDKYQAIIEIAGEFPEEHVNITKNTKYRKVNQCILEAYLVLNDFTSRKWVSSNMDPELDFILTPIEYSIKIQDNKVINYSLYNIDQIKKYKDLSNSSKLLKEKESKVNQNTFILNDLESSKTIKSNNKMNFISIEDMKITRRTYNILLRLGLDTIDKLENYDLDMLKQQKNVGVGTIKEVVSLLKLYSKKEINENSLNQNFKKYIIQKKNFIPDDFDNESQKKITQEVNMNKTLKEYLIFIINNVTLGTLKNKEIFELRYGLINDEKLTLEAIGNKYNLSKERVRQINNRTITRIKKTCTYAYHHKKGFVLMAFYNHLESLRKKINDNVTDGVVKMSFVHQLLLGEFNDQNIIYWKLINKLLGANYKVFNDTAVKNEINSISNEEIKEVIISCVSAFDGKYGITGITKILKGSKNLKHNEYNKASLNSEYYGIYNKLSTSHISSIIEELIEEGILKSQKINYWGHLVLKIDDNFKKEVSLKDSYIPINQTSEKRVFLKGLNFIFKFIKKL